VVVAAASRGGLGVILTDGVGGPTLYRYTPDGTGPSTCSGECAQAWPPLTAASASAVTAGSGVPAADLGTVARSGGSLQVTYKGMPLYTYVGDTQPSQTSGQGVGGVWYVVVPTDPARASPSP
jgi:predicted lipoprotein with Yx(FWY)xxD motif